MVFAERMLFKISKLIHGPALIPWPNAPFSKDDYFGELWKSWSIRLSD